GPLLPSLPIVQRTRPEALRKTTAAQAAVTAPWADMSPAGIRGRPATADKPASRETKNPLADALTVVAAAMSNAAGVVATVAAVGIEADRRKVDEKFQWRR